MTSNWRFLLSNRLKIFKNFHDFFQVFKASIIIYHGQNWTTAQPQKANQDCQSCGRKSVCQFFPPIFEQQNWDLVKMLFDSKTKSWGRVKVWRKNTIVKCLEQNMNISQTRWFLQSQGLAMNGFFHRNHGQNWTFSVRNKELFK
jgi:hypothetical protein